MMELVIRVSCCGCKPRYYKENFTETQLQWIKDNPTDEGCCLKCGKYKRTFKAIEIDGIRKMFLKNTVTAISKHFGISPREVLMAAPKKEKLEWSRRLREEKLKIRLQIRLQIKEEKLMLKKQQNMTRRKKV